MYKAVVLVATLCATLALADRDTRINNRFALTVARRDALRQKHGLGVYAKKNLAQEEGDTTSTDGEPTNTYGFIDCAKGLAQGLQFSSSSDGICYITVDETLNAVNDFTSLVFHAYNPTVWADLMSISSEYTDYLAAIQSNCDLQKLLNTFTTDITTLVPQMAARVSGGLIFEIPKYWKNIKSAESCDVVFYNGGKFFSLLFDYYLS